MNRGLQRGTTLVVLLTLIVLASLAMASFVSAQASESGSVGTSGGTLSFAGGDVTVKVPDAAVSATIDLGYAPWTASTSPAAAPSGTIFGSQLFELDVSKGDVAQTSYSFSGFIQVTVKYTDADLAQATGGRDDNVNLYVYDSAFNRWNRDASAIQDIVNRTLTSSQTSLGAAGASGFALVITGPAPTPTVVAEPPPTGDAALGSSLLMGIALAGAILILGGGYVFLRGSRIGRA